MKKISKSGEQASIIQKERKRRRTKEEKELAIQRLDSVRKKHKILLRRVLTQEVEERTEEEIRQQEQELNDRKKPVKQKIPKVDDKKKFISDLLCPNLKLVRKGEYAVCTKCGAKFKAKAKNNKGTTK